MQEDKALSYLVLGGEQDDAFDPVDTENLLAQLSAGSLITHDMELEEDTDVVQLLAEPNLSALEKAQLLSQSQYDHHRSFLARELPAILFQMKPSRAIAHIIPIIRDFSLDTMDPVRESLASQLDKVVLFFYRNSDIVHDTKERTIMDEYSEDDDDDDDEDSDQDSQYSSKPPLPHDVFTPVFMSLLLDQNPRIANQARLAIDVIAQSVPDEVMESEILNGLIKRLERLFTPEDRSDQDEDSLHLSINEQDGEPELGKMLVVVLLTALTPLLGPERCTQILVPRLEQFTQNSQFYVRKEIVIALGALCKIVDQDVVVNRLLPLYDSFVQDDTWHIRQACCTILASLVVSLPVDMRATKAEEIYSIFSVDVSRNVRNSIMEVLGEVIVGFERDNVPESLLNHFLDMGQNPMNEQERAVMCAFSFPAVVLTAGRSKWEIMKPVYMRLAGTFRPPIRRSLACSLHEIARILGPELADRDLALAFADCLVAEDDVREGVLEHAADFVSCLSPKCRSNAIQDLYRAWTDLERSSNWRLRHVLVGQLPGLCEVAEGNDLLQVLIPLCIKACTDNVSAVREYAVMVFPALWEASERVGSVPEPKTHDAGSSGLDTPLDEGEDDQDKTLNDAFFSFYNQTPNNDLQDVEMEDMTGDFTFAGPPKDVIDTSVKETDDEASSDVTTTVKEQIIHQTTTFAITGGFRSRVVAVQIIQSLLDYGITTAEFEEHFLWLLVDRFAVDRVVNVRMWVARVLSWIVDSGYYGDAALPQSLGDLITTMQQDPDREVRMYAGGPAELPESKKDTSASKRQRDEETERKDEPKKAVLSVFCENPESGQLTVVEDDGEAVVPQALGVMDHGNNESDDGDARVRDEEKDGQDSHVDDNHPEDLSEPIRESIIFTSDDISEDMVFEEGETDSPNDAVLDSEDTIISTISVDLETEEVAIGIAVLKDDPVEIKEESQEQEQEQEQKEDKGEVNEQGVEEEDDDEEEEEEDDEDEDEDEDEAVTERVIPYTALNANGISPLDLEVDEQPSKDKDEPRTETTENEAPAESFTAMPNATRAAEPTTVSDPSALAFPPLSLSSKTAPIAIRHPQPLKLSYAASVKYGRDDSRAKAHGPVSAPKANTPEPPALPSSSPPSDTSLHDMKAALAFDGNRKPFLGRVPSPSNKDNAHKDDSDIFKGPLSPSFPSLSASSSASSSAATSRSSTPVSSASSSPASSPPPISYASVVASGAAVAAAAAAAAATSRGFPSSLSSAINTSSATLTF
ncbi:Serine/threonine-protein phosphatase 4 regulatory subunit 1 [Mortierella sp. NVP85]|nr:Serine/threonine-protein phosphatase 4 regulatory subunit 1 [Mortierella sp. NVP85]